MIADRQVSVCQILIRSPFDIFQRRNQSQSFFQMLKTLLAPFYRIQSVTTVLMCITAIVYITLVYRHPPFIKIPTFALQPLILQPQHLKHYEFYRLITSPFVVGDITTLILLEIVLWSLGSFTEQIYGWRICSIVTGFYGLIGYNFSLSLPCYLIGANFAYALTAWPNPQIPILYRKITLIIYFVLCLVYVLIFISQEVHQRYSIYSCTVYGFLLSMIFGSSKDGANISTFRKVLQLLSGLCFIILTTTLITNIIFKRQTLV